MGLTPEEVRDVTFPRPPWGRRGYHEHSVDAFLDYVCAELTRLQVDYRDLARLSEENVRLRQQLAELTGQRDAGDAQPAEESIGRHHYAEASDRSRSARHF